MNSVVLQHIEFVKLRRHLVLAILVSTAGLVHNRIIEVEEDFHNPNWTIFRII